MIAFTIASVLISCWVQFALYEAIVKIDPNAASLITLCQFASVVGMGLISNLVLSASNDNNLLKAKRAVPLWIYLAFAFAYVIVQKSNNAAFSFGISMPLSTIYRSCTLIASLLFGWLFFARVYKLNQIVGACMVTIGIGLCTLLDSHKKQKPSSSCTSDGAGLGCNGDIGSNKMSEEELYQWLLGVLLMTLALVISGFLGHFQEMVYKKYTVNSKKPYKEFMFYIHVFSLPFLLLMNHEKYQKQLFELSSCYIEGTCNDLIIYLVLNTVTNYLCLESVYALSAATSPITLNIVLSVRKVGSLVFSVLYFKNSFTGGQWMGAGLVFVGAYIYSNAWEKQKEAKEEAKKKED